MAKLLTTVARFLALDKMKRIYDIIRHNGGIIGSLSTAYRTDELKIGDLIGVDKFGNKYYENKMYFYGRDRWVDYNPAMHLDYDASQVPPEWHRWLHHITDDPPTIKPPVNHEWLAQHTPNMSGTKDAYIPYSTTLPKITPWQPHKK